jgi:hypothetical protein
LCQDQDALNATLDGKVLVAPWYLYNCPPVMMVCRKADIDAGRIQPLYRSQAADIDAAPELYLDMTQAIYDVAHIIHYMADTKPDCAHRPQANCYRIFDQAYYDVKNGTKS